MFGGDISWLILGCGYMQVKVPTLFLLGAQDRRVPVSNGFQVSWPHHFCNCVITWCSANWGNTPLN